MPPTIGLTPEKISLYRTAGERRHRQEQAEIAQRREQAWAAARLAAQLLKKQFHVSKVVLFGSLARNFDFTRWSDVDIAAWDIAPEDTFRAIGAVMDLDTDVTVNLVDVSTVRPSLLDAIKEDGIEL